MVESLLIAKTMPANGGQECRLLPQMANRHGLIAGATGTGKTVTLQAIAERFSQIGVPVFVTDIKGDLAGISQPGGNHAKVRDRIQQLELSEFPYQPSPVTLWDVFGQQGHPLRATVSEIGPLLLARLLNLNATQAGVLNIAFQVADDQGLLLLDLKDLRALLQHVGETARQLKPEYGNVSTASVGAIQRSLLSLEQQGGDRFFGEPALDLMDLIQTDRNGQGRVNVLAANQLIQSPKLYATFLLWLLSELFEQLPEVGDLDQPKLVFLFDEAHLLFTPDFKALRDPIDQVIRLIRSKGVGVYFCTQSPADLPVKVLGQLGNRVQHALRAFTPLDQKAIKAAAQTFRPNPAFKVEQAIAELEVGEALISCLNSQGAPEVVERAYIVPPQSQIGAISPEQRQQCLQDSAIYGHYEPLRDRESAYEILQQKAEATAQATPAASQAQSPSAAAEAKQAAILQKQQAKAAAAQAKAEERAQQEREKMLLSLAEGTAQAFAGTTGKKIARGVLGGILGYGTTRKRR